MINHMSYVLDYYMFFVSSTISPPKLLQLWGMKISTLKVSVTPHKLGVQTFIHI